MNKLMAMVILFSLAACQSKVSEDEEGGEAVILTDEIQFTDEQLNLAGIVSDQLEQMILSDELKCNGSVEMPPQSLVSVTLPLDGYVKRINAYTGSKVRKGDLLAVMEHPDYLNLQQEYLVTGNNLALLQKNLERQKVLVKADASSEKLLMVSETEYQNSLIRYTALGEQLKLLGINPGRLTLNNLNSELRVLSPITGHVRKNNGNTGELMQAGDPIMDLEDVSHLHVHLIVYEKDVNKVRKGQAVKFTTGSGDKDYLGTINTVGKSIDEETRSVTVHVHLSNPDAALLSGMYVKARIMLNSKTVYALPEGGIGRYGGQNFVFVRTGNSFKRIAVEISVKQDGFAGIKSPESLLGKELVTAGAYYLNATFNVEE